MRHRFAREAVLGSLALAGVLAAVASAALAVANDRAAGPAGAESGSRVTAFVDRVVARQRSVQALRARFVEVKESALLLEPVRSSGEFYYLAPDHVRWDYHQPSSMVVLVDEDSVTTYHPEQKRAQRVRISGSDRRFVRALAGHLPFDDLTSQFRIRFVDRGAPLPYRLELEPTGGRLGRRLDELLLEVDRDLLLPVVVQYDEADGDRTRYEFHRLEVDPEMAKGRFRLDLGDDVQVRTIDTGAGLR